MESTTEQNAALVREFLTEVLAGGDLDALDILLTDGAVSHDPVLEEASAPPAGQALCRVLAAAEVEIEIEDLVAAEDMVAIRGTVTGTHRASLVDVTATGRTFEVAYAWFCRVEDGQIAEIWSLPDAGQLQRQLESSSRRPTDESRPG